MGRRKRGWSEIQREEANGTREQLPKAIRLFSLRLALSTQMPDIALTFGKFGQFIALTFSKFCCLY